MWSDGEELWLVAAVWTSALLTTASVGTTKPWPRLSGSLSAPYELGWGTWSLPDLIEKAVQERNAARAGSAMQKFAEVAGAGGYGLGTLGV